MSTPNMLPPETDTIVSTVLDHDVCTTPDGLVYIDPPSIHLHAHRAGPWRMGRSFDCGHLPTFGAIYIVDHAHDFAACLPCAEAWVDVDD
jgi:hypothetical protein